MTEDEKGGGNGEQGKQGPVGGPLMGGGLLERTARWAAASAPLRAGVIPEPETASALASPHAREAPDPDLCKAGNRRLSETAQTCPVLGHLWVLSAAHLPLAPTLGSWPSGLCSGLHQDLLGEVS